MRRMGERVQHGRRYRYRNGVYVVALAGNSVLLTFQQAPEAEFQLPGGGVDDGEPPLRALHREVMEETGWRIAEPRRIGAYRRFSYMPAYDTWAEKICALYLARAVSRISPPAEAGHIDVLVPLEDAPSLVGSEGDRAVLRLVRGA